MEAFLKISENHEKIVEKVDFFSSISLSGSGSGSGFRIRIRIQSGNLNPDPPISGSETLVTGSGSGSGFPIRIRIQSGNLNPDPPGSGSETQDQPEYFNGGMFSLHHWNSIIAGPRVPVPWVAVPPGPSCPQQNQDRFSTAPPQLSNQASPPLPSSPLLIQIGKQLV